MFEQLAAERAALIAEAQGIFARAEAEGALTEEEKARDDEITERLQAISQEIDELAARDAAGLEKSLAEAEATIAESEIKLAALEVAVELYRLAATPYVTETVCGLQEGLELEEARTRAAERVLVDVPGDARPNDEPDIGDADYKEDDKVPAEVRGQVDTLAHVFSILSGR